MDRVQVYPSQVPLETDLLNTNRNVLIALGALSGALFGTGGIVRGLVVGASSPAALTVAVGPGEIYQQAAVDATAYSSLPADTTDTIVKQGLLLAKNAPVTLACPAPATSGQSINYLIQAAYADADINPLTLPYYDASNPTVAWSGPNNSGATNNTTRAGQVNLAVKAGTPATTGSQTTPATDAGFIALAVVTVAYGQATITAANITAVKSGSLPGDLLHTIQQGTANYALDAGAANASVVSITPAPASLTDGLPVFFRVAASNTGAATLNLNGLGTYPIVGPTGGAIVSGELTAGQIASVVWNAPLAAWQLQGFASGSTSGAVTAGTYGSATSVAVIGISSAGVVTSANSTPIAFPVTSVFGRTGAVALESGDVSTALGYTPLGANIAADTLLGNPTGSAAAPSAITLADGLQFSGSTLGLGSITVTGLTDTGNAQIQGLLVVGSSNAAAGALDVETSSSVGRILLRTASVNSTTVSTLDSVNAADSAYAPLNIGATALTTSAPTTISSTLGVTGNTSLGGTLSVTGNATLSGSLTTTGATYANGALTVGTSGTPTSLQVYGSATITGTITSGQTFQSSTTSVVLAATGAGSVLLRPNGAASTAGELYIDANGNVGINTQPTSVTGIGNPVVGASNIVAYNAGNIGLSLLTDNALARTQQISFGASGIGTFDAGLSYSTSTRILSIYAGSASRVQVDANGNVGLGTTPTSVPSVGNPVLGAYNLIGYNVGNIGLTLLTDNGAARTSQIGFGSAGVSTFDAGLQYNNSTRTLSFFASSASRATLDTSGNFVAVGSVSGVNLNASGNVSATGNVSGVNLTASGYLSAAAASTISTSTASNVPLTLTAAHTSDTHLAVANTSTSGRSWAIGTAGSSPPTGMTVGDFFVYDNTASAWRQRIDSSGNAYFAAALTTGGNATVNGNLQVNGTISNTSTVNFNTSDETLKDDIDRTAEPQPLHRASPFTTYRRTDTGERGRGLISQDLREVQPLYVGEYAHPMPDGTTSPKLGVAYAAAALEEAWWCGRQVDDLLSRVAALEAR